MYHVTWSWVLDLLLLEPILAEIIVLWVMYLLMFFLFEHLFNKLAEATFIWAVNVNYLKRMIASLLQNIKGSFFVSVFAVSHLPLLPAVLLHTRSELKVCVVHGLLWSHDTFKYVTNFVEERKYSSTPELIQIRSTARNILTNACSS